ncbi:MAG TPA: hypothetical protein VLS53_05325 [Candidatus Dormibacteraeota bacterium]|nr:hypothetical protein [Candidatus Dormibacteraeota bacterium]
MSRERATGRQARVVAEEKEPTPGEIGAVQGADPDRLLDGEDPETLQIHDIDHWIRVYQDLLAFKRQLLATANEIVPDLADAAREEVGKTDLPAMDAEARKFQRRLEFWQQRRKQLEGSK